MIVFVFDLLDKGSGGFLRILTGCWLLQQLTSPSILSRLS